MDLEEKNPFVGLDNNGRVVVKNRAYRRKRKTTAELEGKKSKHFYTRRRNGKKSRKIKKNS